MADATLGCMVDVTLVLPMADVDVGTIDVDVPVGCMQAVSMIDVNVAVYVVDPYVDVCVGCMVDVAVVVYVVDPIVNVYVCADCVQLVTVGCMAIAGDSSKSSCTVKSFSLSMGVSPSWSL